MIIAIESAESFPTRPVMRPGIQLQELPSFCFIAFSVYGGTLVAQGTRFILEHFSRSERCVPMG
jgi:hypothetical protein